MSIEDNPEFQKALNDASERQWGNWLYGGDFKKVSRKNMEKTLAQIQKLKGSAEAKAEAAIRKAEIAQIKADAIQRKVDQIRVRYDPSLKRITENIRMKNNLSRGLVCPKCGAGPRVEVKGVTYVNHKMNGKPWCVKCKVELISPDKIGKWVSLKQGNLEGVRRGMRGLP